MSRRKCQTDTFVHTISLSIHQIFVLMSLSQVLRGAFPTCGPKLNLALRRGEQVEHKGEYVCIEQGGKRGG